MLYRNRQEMSRLESEVDSLRDRYASAIEELALTNDDRIRLTEQVDQLKQQLQKAFDEKNFIQRDTAKQVCSGELLSTICEFVCKVVATR